MPFWIMEPFGTNGGTVLTSVEIDERISPESVRYDVERGDGDAQAQPNRTARGVQERRARRARRAKWMIKLKVPPQTATSWGAVAAASPSVDSADHGSCQLEVRERPSVATALATCTA